MTYRWGNNHGSIMEINGKWYVFYHRQTGVNEYSRQSMLEPIDVALGKDGLLYIGDVRYVSGEPVSSRPVEMTSQGPHINGLDAYKWISAGYACHIYGGKRNAYIRPDYEQREDLSTPVVDITSGTTIGFRYLQFGQNAPKTVTAVLEEGKKVTVNVRLDSYRGRIISTILFDGEQKEKTERITAGVIGKHAIYFEFVSDNEDECFIFDRLSFDR